MFQPPSPASSKNSFEPSALLPDLAQANPKPPSGPPMIASAENPDPGPSPENAESSEGNRRRTVRGWFIIMMKKGGQNRTSHQTSSKESPPISVPQARASPSNEKFSMMAAAQRVKVSIPFLSVDRAPMSDDLTQRTVTKSTRTVRPQVRSCGIPFTNVTTYQYNPSQKKAALKPTASSEPPKAPPRTEASPASPTDKTKPEPSGAQHDDKVRVHFGRSEAEAHVDYCSKHRET